MKRRILVTTIVALLGAGAWSAPAGAAEPVGTTTSTVAGSWAQIVNCVFTHYDLQSGDFTCVGGSTWQGSWTGVTHYDVKGHYDVATGNMRGTLVEDFVGLYLPDRSHGILHMAHRFTLDGATSALHIESTILGGEGDPTFRCSSGHLTWDGTAPGETGWGGYSGTWVHGCP